MKKNTKQSVIEDILSRLSKLSIASLYKEIEDLPYDVHERVLSKFLPATFVSLIAHELKVKKVCTELWDDHSLPITFLHALTPQQLVFLGSKHVAGKGAWGNWPPSEDLSENISDREHCENLSHYFSQCPHERLVGIVSWLINSTKGVTAPKSESERNIFVYTEGEQFPSEVVYLLSTIYPQKLFPVINDLSDWQFERLLFLCKKMAGESNTIENIFANSYKEKGHVIYWEEISAKLIAHMPLLTDDRFYQLWDLFSVENQEQLVANLSPERLLQMQKNGYFSSYGNSFQKDSIEKIRDEVFSGKRSVKRLSSKRAIQLLAALSA
jgi:hypothetical protein